MHVVRLLSPQINGEDHTKDIDFSKSGIRMRWEAGLRDARQALAEQPWRSDVDPREGFYLHELRRDRIDPAHLMDRTPTLVDDMQAAIER